MNSKITKIQPPWQETERRIFQEMDWLRGAIETFFNEEKNGILD